MPHRPPLVGVTAAIDRVREDGAAPIDAAYVDAACLAAVRAAGLLAVMLPPDDPSRAEHALDAVDALAVEPESVLADLSGTASHAVNSCHHQAIGEVAPPLAAAAWCEDGVVEGGVARDAAWPAIGVRWHPEDPPEDPDRRLFARLGERARQCAHARAR